MPKAGPTASHAGTSRRGNASAAPLRPGGGAWRTRTPSPGPARSSSSPQKSPRKPESTLVASDLTRSLPPELIGEILKYHYHPRPDSDPFTAANSDTTPLYIQQALLGSLGWHMYREAAWTQLWETITLVTKPCLDKLRSALLFNIQQREQAKLLGRAEPPFARPVIRCLRTEIELGTAHTQLGMPPALEDWRKLHRLLIGSVGVDVSIPGKISYPAVPKEQRIDLRSSIETLIIVLRDQNRAAISDEVLHELSRFTGVRRLRIEFPEQSLGFWTWPGLAEFVAKFPALEALRIDRGRFQDYTQSPAQVGVPTTLKTLYLSGNAIPLGHLEPFLRVDQLQLTTLALIDVRLPEEALVQIVTRVARTLESLTFVVGSQDEPLPDRKRLIEMRETAHAGEWALKDRKTDPFGMSVLPPIGPRRPVDDALQACFGYGKLREVVVGGPFALSPSMLGLLPSTLESLELVNCPDVRPTADYGTETYAEEVEMLKTTPLGIASRDIVAKLAEDSFASFFDRWKRLTVRGCGSNWARYGEDGVVDELLFTAGGEEVADPRPYDGALGRACEDRGIRLEIALARRGE